MRLKLLAYVVIAICLVYGFTSIFYNNVVLVGIDHRPLTGAVVHSGKIGIYDIRGVPEINLGTTSPSHYFKIQREVINNETFPIDVTIEKLGLISPLITVEPQEFVLEPGEEGKYFIKFLPSWDTKPGDYEGELKITKKRIFG